MNFYFDAEAAREPRPFFVYGSLLSGLHNHALIADEVTSLTTATVADVDLHANGYAFPYAVAAAGGSAQGQIVAVSEADFPITLFRLDGLEGYQGKGANNHYDRVLVTAVDQDGNEVECWMYLAAADIAEMVKEGAPKVPHGDWRAWMSQEPVRS